MHTTTLTQQSPEIEMPPDAFTTEDHRNPRRIFLDSADNLITAATGRTFINCATVTPGIHREVFAAAQAAGADALEASMASSISHAREGKLYLMLAGDEAVYQRVLPVLEHMSINRRYIGGPGLAAALGHDLDLVREVFSQTGANSRVLETDAADMVAREHDCWFSAEHAAKDSGIAGLIAAEAGLTLPLNTAT